MIERPFHPLEMPAWMKARVESVCFALNVCLITISVMAVIAYLPEWMG